MQIGCCRSPCTSPQTRSIQRVSASSSWTTLMYPRTATTRSFGSDCRLSDGVTPSADDLAGRKAESSRTPPHSASLAKKYGRFCTQNSMRFTKIGLEGRVSQRSEYKGYRASIDIEEYERMWPSDDYPKEAHAGEFYFSREREGFVSVSLCATDRDRLAPLLLTQGYHGLSVSLSATKDDLRASHFRGCDVVRSASVRDPAEIADYPPIHRPVPASAGGLYRLASSA